MNYVLPFLMFIIVLAIVTMRVQALGGPGLLNATFFIILFGPSFLYALVEDDSSSLLFFVSLLVALVVVAIMGFFLYRKKASRPQVLAEITLHGIDDEAAPTLVIFANNESWLLTEYFPWENSKITEEMLTGDLADLLKVKIVRTDRHCFKIMSSDNAIIKKVALYIKQNK